MTERQIKSQVLLFHFAQGMKSWDWDAECPAETNRSNQNFQKFSNWNREDTQQQFSQKGPT
jgi:hypothetical protein